jgi:hypothetical protein
VNASFEQFFHRDACHKKAPVLRPALRSVHRGPGLC